VTPITKTSIVGRIVVRSVGWGEQSETHRSPRHLGQNLRQCAAQAQQDGKWVNMRVLYPLGFFSKHIDGRIDDPNAGWKGRAVWSTDGNRTPFHRETGKGTLPKIVKLQVRPDPLAR